MLTVAAASASAALAASTASGQLMEGPEAAVQPLPSSRPATARRRPQALSRRPLPSTTKQAPRHGASTRSFRAPTRQPSPHAASTHKSRAAVGTGDATTASDTGERGRDPRRSNGSHAASARAVPGADEATLDRTRHRHAGRRRGTGTPPPPATSRRGRDPRRGKPRRTRRRPDVPGADEAALAARGIDTQVAAVGTGDATTASDLATPRSTTRQPPHAASARRSRRGRGNPHRTRDRDAGSTRRGDARRPWHRDARGGRRLGHGVRGSVTRLRHGGSGRRPRRGGPADRRRRIRRSAAAHDARLDGLDGGPRCGGGPRLSRTEPRGVREQTAFDRGRYCEWRDGARFAGLKGRTGVNGGMVLAPPRQRERQRDSSVATSRRSAASSALYAALRVSFPIAPRKIQRRTSLPSGRPPREGWCAARREVELQRQLLDERGVGRTARRELEAVGDERAEDAYLADAGAQRRRRARRSWRRRAPRGRAAATASPARPCARSESRRRRPAGSCR